MLIFNGVRCETIEQLETQMVGLSEEQKQFARNDFNGVGNTPIVGVPSQVTPRQIRIALISSGIPLSTIESGIEALSEPTRSIARVTWEYSVAFERSNPLINSLGPSLGLSIEQIDNLFRLAATL